MAAQVWPGKLVQTFASVYKLYGEGTVLPCQSGALPVVPVHVCGWPGPACHSLVKWLMGTDSHAENCPSASMSRPQERIRVTPGALRAIAVTASSHSGNTLT